MVRILRMLRNVFRDFHHAELIALWSSILGIVLFPFILLLVGAFFGSISWTAKVIVVEIELYFVTFFLLWLSWRRLIIGTEIATLLRAENLRSISLKTIKTAANDYVTLVAAILASELAAGYIVLWLPVHQNYLLSFLAITSVVALVSYTVWRGGEFWWPKLVYKLAIFTLVVSLSAIIMPQTTRLISRLIEGMDAKIAGGLECLENSNLPQCQKKAVLISTSSPTAIAPFEEFILKVGEPVQTVEAGPGTHHRIQSDKRFIAVAIQQDGSERKYEMLAGTSYWNGAVPWGRLLLEAVEDGTRVKIVPIS